MSPDHPISPFSRRHITWHCYFVRDGLQRWNHLGTTIQLVRYLFICTCVYMVAVFLRTWGAHCAWLNFIVFDYHKLCIKCMCTDLYIIYTSLMSREITTWCSAVLTVGTCVLRLTKYFLQNLTYLITRRTVPKVIIRFSTCNTNKTIVRFMHRGKSLLHFIRVCMCLGEHMFRYTVNTRRIVGIFFLKYNISQSNKTLITRWRQRVGRNLQRIMMYWGNTSVSNFVISIRQR